MQANPPLRNEIVIDDIAAGRLVRRAREASKVGLREMAEAIGVSHEQLRLLENGDAHWSETQYARAAQFLVTRENNQAQP